MRLLGTILVAILLASPLAAQQNKRDPLTEAQEDKIRDLGGFPNERVKFYTQIIEEHANTIKGLTNRARSTARAQRLDGELQDLTALMDELGENLDVYSDRHSDIRPALKTLSEAAPRWAHILRALAGEPGFDEARKEAIESCEQLSDQATRLLSEQEEFFRTHKDLRGQERDEPK